MFHWVPEVLALSIVRIHYTSTHSAQCVGHNILIFKPPGSCWGQRGKQQQGKPPAKDIPGNTTPHYCCVQTGLGLTGVRVIWVDLLWAVRSLISRSHTPLHSTPLLSCHLAISGQQKRPDPHLTVCVTLLPHCTGNKYEQSVLLLRRIAQCQCLSAAPVSAWLTDWCGGVQYWLYSVQPAVQSVQPGTHRNTIHWAIHI